jgi:hypothetical protein
MFTLLAPLQSMRNVADAKREEAKKEATVARGIQYSAF